MQTVSIIPIDKAIPTEKIIPMDIKASLSQIIPTDEAIPTEATMPMEIRMSLMQIIPTDTVIPTEKTILMDGEMSLQQVIPTETIIPMDNGMLIPLEHRRQIVSHSTLPMVPIGGVKHLLVLSRGRSVRIVHSLSPHHHSMLLVDMIDNGIHRFNSMMAEQY